jgi:predicted Zn-dependent protease
MTSGRHDRSEYWATECLHIDVFDFANHVLLADALAAQKKFAPAVEEYQTALDLKPRKPNDLRVKLARAQLGLGHRDQAQATLEALLRDDPDHPEVKALREEIARQEPNR